MEDYKKGFKGNVVGVALQDLIQLFCTSGADVLLRVKSSAGEGAICIFSGQVVHAQTPHQEGENAFYEILTWPGGEFTAYPLEGEWVGKVSINKPWEHLILEGARLADELSLKPSSEEAKKSNVVYCSNCNKRFQLPLEKIPPGKIVKVRCPSCGTGIEIQRDENVIDAFELELEKWKREEFDIAEVIKGESGFLLCSSDDILINKIEEVLKPLDYHIVVANTARDGFKMIREGLCEVILLDERLGMGKDQGSNILIYFLQKLTPSIRRHFYVCVISDAMKTRDQWAAFRLGVDLVVNRKNVDILADLLHYEMNRRRKFYSAFMEELQILRA